MRDPSARTRAGLESNRPRAAIQYPANLSDSVLGTHTVKNWLRRLVLGSRVLRVSLVFLGLTASLIVPRAPRPFSWSRASTTGAPWSWADVRDQLSHVSRACAYDRAGILWSEPLEAPRDAERIAGEVRALLNLLPSAMAGVVSDPFRMACALASTSGTTRAGRSPRQPLGPRR